MSDPSQELSLPDVLVLAAVPSEVDRLPGLAVGVGPVRAAAGTARLLAAYRPSAVVLVGTAGRYPGGPPIGSAVVATEVGYEHTGATAGLAYLPLPPPPLPTDPTLRAAVAHLPAVAVATVGAITSDADLSATLGQRWQAEHMEAYSVAHACAAVGVPFLAILGIANTVGPTAHEEWLQHRAQAEAAARAAVRAHYRTMDVPHPM